MSRLQNSHFYHIQKQPVYQETGQFRSTIWGVVLSVITKSARHTLFG